MMPFGAPFGFNIMFSIIPVIVVIGFIFVFGTIIVRAAQGARQWHRNNNSPILTVDAKVAAKRIDVSSYTHHHGDMHMHHTSHSTTYYATFEFESCDRLELVIPDAEYGYIVQGDTGKLTFQGTRYLGFQRIPQSGDVTL
jgi:hypothetical protein